MKQLVLGPILLACIAATSRAADDKIGRRGPPEQKPRPSRHRVVRRHRRAGTRTRLHNPFRDLAAAAKDEFRFRVATGTYADVEHWMHARADRLGVRNTGTSFTPPALPAELNRTVDRSPTDVAVDETNSDLLNEHVRYLANVGLPPAVSPWTRPERKTPGYHDRFRSVALVKRDSSLQTIEDLVDAAMHGRLRVPCVSPLSVSGSIAPRFALAKKGIRLDPTQIEYTHSHSASGRLLAETCADDDESRP